MYRKICSHTEDTTVTFTHPAGGSRELGLMLLEFTGLSPERFYSLNDLSKVGGHSGAAMEPNLAIYHPPDSQEDYLLDVLGLFCSGPAPAGGFFPTHTLKPIDYIDGTNISGGAFWGTWTYPPVYNEAPWIDDYTTTESRTVADTLDVMPRRFSVDREDGYTRTERLRVLEYLDILTEYPAGGYPLPPDNPNEIRLFIRDNGSGKTQLCARFNVGTVIVLGTET
jgi:hypothetical protein